MAGKFFDKCFFLNYNTFDDINLYEIGTQKCLPDYEVGPIIRERYILHYVISGKGILFLDGKEYHPKPYQCFLIAPNVVSHYKADHDNPWNYMWIHIDGNKVVELLHKVGMSVSNPVYFPMKEDAKLEQAFYNILLYHNNELESIAGLYHLFAQLLQNSAEQPIEQNQDIWLKYIKMIINFITEKYSEPINVQDLADLCGLHRSYFSKMFKHGTGYSPKEYLIRFRMKRAKKLLEEKELSIQNIAYSVGYTDLFTFSKAFHKANGISPSAYRKIHLKNIVKENNFGMNDF